MSCRRLIFIALLFCAAPAGAQLQVDINRPRSPFECDLENARRWYGSQQRCLKELCGSANTTNEWVFDDGGKRRRRNPCYRVDPFNFSD